MARIRDSRTDRSVAWTADRARSSAVPRRSAYVTDRDIAYRAQDLSVARGREPGHDLDDWLQAERERRAHASPQRRESPRLP
jgi:hypothetical protein